MVSSLALFLIREVNVIFMRCGIRIHSLIKAPLISYTHMAFGNVLGPRNQHESPADLGTSQSLCRF